MAGYEVMGENNYDSLLAGNQFPVMVKGVTLAANQGILARGTVLGIITASGLAVPCKAAAADGSGTPKYILTYDTDTGTADPVGAAAYQSGVFNRSALVLAAGESAAAFEDALRIRNIILTDSMENPTVPLEAISIAPVSVSLSLAGTKTSQLSVAFTPPDASDQTVTYSSSNESAATVSASGFVTAMAAGATTITAVSRDGGNTATCTVTVTA